MNVRQAAAVMAAAAVVLSGCAANSAALANDASEPRTTAFHASEPVYFATLAELVATADVAMIATVREVSAGPVSFPGTPDEVRRTTLILEHEVVLHGEAPPGPVTVETLELAYTAPHHEWRVPGTRVVAFLTKSLEGRPLFIPTNHSQAVYVLSADDLVATVGDDLSEQVAASSLPEFLVAVAEAERSIQRGETVPKERSD